MLGVTAWLSCRQERCVDYIKLLIDELTSSERDTYPLDMCLIKSNDGINRQLSQRSPRYLYLTLVQTPQIAVVHSFAIAESHRTISLVF